MESGAGQIYTVTPLEELMEYPVPLIAEPDSVMFMWATTPMKEDAMTLLKAWGYKYKTTIYWHKGGKDGKPGRLGMGYWFRGEVEELLFGIRGNVKPFRTSIRNHISHPALAHSEKPECFRHLVEKVTTAANLLTRLEMFARKRVDGWDAWGDQS